MEMRETSSSQLNSNMGLYHVILTSPKTSSEKLTLTVVEMQESPDREKTDLEGEKSCLKRKIYFG